MIDNYLDTLTPQQKVQMTQQVPDNIEQMIRQYNLQQQPYQQSQPQQDVDLDALLSSLQGEQSQPQQKTQSNMSSLSDFLNAIASGKGDVNYDTLSASYPIPRQPINTPVAQRMASNLAKMQGPGGVGGKLFRAFESAKDQQIAEQNAYNQQMNKNDTDKLNALLQMAGKSGTLQANRMNADALEKYRDAELALKNNELGLREQQIDQSNAALVPMADGTYGLFDRRHPEDGVTPLDGTKFTPKVGQNQVMRKLPVGTQLAAYKEIDNQLGMLDERGKMNPDAYPLRDDQRSAIADAVVSQLQSDPNMSIPGAVSRALQALGGIKNIRDQTEDKSFLGFGYKGNTGKREFPNIDALNGLISIKNNTPTINGAAGVSTVPPESINDITNPAAPDDALSGIDKREDGVYMPNSISQVAALPGGTRFYDPYSKKIRIKPSYK